MNFFQELKNALTTRKAEWFKDNPDRLESPSLSFRAMELGGEAGEVLNECKKLERTRLGMVGGKTDTSDLADELGDLIITAQLVASKADIDLDEAVRCKFNKTSDKHGMSTKMIEGEHEN